MIELNSRQRRVRDICRDGAEDLRARALSVDADPDAMDAHFDSPVFALIRRSHTSVEYRDAASAGTTSLPESKACLDDVVAMTEFARGDASMVLACPSPALAGVFVDRLGSAEQKERFYSRLRDGRTYTFFAMTEPDHGTDATAMETRFDRDGDGGWLLHGAKRYIGNGARGGVGVVFGRTGRSTLSIRAALVELPTPGWTGRRLDMVGLRGAYLSELRFDGVPLGGDSLLGEHLPVTRRGIWGAIETFNHMRIQIAAAAVGTAVAMAEYVAEHNKSARGVRLAQARADAARELIYEAAARIDNDPKRGYLSSAVKLGATRMAVETGRWAANAFGPAGLLEHPLLEKWTRDVCAFEFMDGTSNIQRLHVARGYQTGDADA
jgi:alkylation response protein AidB-like acyl-CoA dehydrogenase